jgi:hypothetical protein
MSQPAQEVGNGFRASRAGAGRTAPGVTDEQFVKVDATIESDEHIAEFDAAIESDSVTLDQIIEVQHHLTSAKDPSAQQLSNTGRRSYAYYLPHLWASYERRNAGWIHRLLMKGKRCRRGKILECYFSRSVQAGAVLTNRDEIHISYPASSVADLAPEFERTLWKCRSQAQEAKQLLLRWGGRRILLKRLYSLLVYLLSVLESQAEVYPEVGATAPDRASKPRIQAALELANEELKELCEQLRQLAYHNAQQLYLLGMIPGIAVLIFLSIIAGRTTISGIDVQDLLIVLAAGGLGAVLSVMTRITSKKTPLEIPDRTSHALITVAGLFRPIIGGIFGLALYILLNAGLVDVFKLPEHDPAKRLFFFGAVAFLAGFSERWAQDVMVGAAPPGGTNEVGSQGHRKE